ncbi:uncharacterized protein L203_101377 [Cryptococcus depauperatus CBS 7841]|uniref:Uncharacterized protein n=1 Tax=Cryptococcus depauperatus CBS 7841 TaxID=1295531 RepID=A0A1E3ICI0_9TREE|nr:hypothetical protein L203_04263 [Cryptococcus depauperatus CBS 7841]
MNRSLRLLKPQSYILPLHPRSAGFSSNLVRPKITSVSVFPGAKVSHYLALSRTLDRHYATGPSTNQDESQEYKEDQNKTAGVKEELKGVTDGLAKLIAGDSTGQPAALGAQEISTTKRHPGSIQEDFSIITSTMWYSVPKPALVFGIAGTLPYLATSIGTVLLAREASIATDAPSGLDLPTILQYLHNFEHIQITYGAVMLSFLGAIHWGMEFSKLGGEKGYKRLALGVVPLLFAWPTTFLSHGVALAAQWVGFTGMWAADQRASSAGWTTAWYSTYRFYLSIIVGFSIIGTLAGTSYYGAGAGASVSPETKRTLHTTGRPSSLKRLDREAEKNDPRHAVLRGKVAGDIQVEEESSEAYLRLRNVAKGDEEEEREEEKEPKAAEQDQKEKKQKESSPAGMKDDQKKRTDDAQGKSEASQSKQEKKPEEDEKDPKQAEQHDQDVKKKQAAEEKKAAGNPNTGMR